jgi:hypothetical protein
VAAHAGELERVNKELAKTRDQLAKELSKNTINYLNIVIRQK